MVGGRARARHAGGQGQLQSPASPRRNGVAGLPGTEPERFGLLYSLVWRANRGELSLDANDDPDLLLARRMAFAVRAEAHRSLLRFMPVQDSEGERLLGWYAPAHFVLEANAQLISHRFPEQHFSIITPDGSAHWDGESLRFGTGLRKATDDTTLAAWWDAHHGAVLADTRDGTSGARKPKRCIIATSRIRCHLGRS